MKFGKQYACLPKGVLAFVVAVDTPKGRLYSQGNGRGTFSRKKAFRFVEGYQTLEVGSGRKVVISAEGWAKAHAGLFRCFDSRGIPAKVIRRVPKKRKARTVRK